MQVNRVDKNNLLIWMDNFKRLAESLSHLAKTSIYNLEVKGNAA